MEFGKYDLPRKPDFEKEHNTSEMVRTRRDGTKYKVGGRPARVHTPEELADLVMWYKKLGSAAKAAKKVTMGEHKAVAYLRDQGLMKAKP